MNNIKNLMKFTKNDWFLYMQKYNLSKKQLYFYWMLIILKIKTPRNIERDIFIKSLLK